MHRSVAQMATVLPGDATAGKWAPSPSSQQHLKSLGSGARADWPKQPDEYGSFHRSPLFLSSAYGYTRVRARRHFKTAATSKTL